MKTIAVSGPGGLLALWRAGLLAHRDFRLMWLSSTVTSFGGQITMLALPLTAVLLLDATPHQMGLMVALEALPFTRSCVGKHVVRDLRAQGGKRDGAHSSAGGHPRAEFDRRRAAGIDDGTAGLNPPADLLRALRDRDPAAIGAALANDLQPAALVLAPHLQQTLDAGLVLGALGSVIAGSGPTCVFLAPDADAASALARGLIRAGVCRTTRVAIGPAVGAQLC